MQIPQIMNPPTSDYRISDNHPRNEFPNQRRYYRQSLYSCLRYFRPKICLEIGTHCYSTSVIFQQYFNDTNTTGVVITVDIQKWVEKPHSLTNVIPLLVTPHLPMKSILKWHKVQEENFTEYDYANSVETNKTVIETELLSQGFDKFDFCFVDGDHQRESVFKDIEICTQLSLAPHYILLDDTHDFMHDSAAIFHDELELWNKYDFSDWKLDGIAGAGLIWEK